MIGFTYAQLNQAMQDWPVNSGTNYLGNISRFVELGELRLVRDLNLEIFDVTDTSQTLTAGAIIVNKPSELISLRTMRIALITGTTNQAAVPTAVCAPQITYQAITPLVLNGTLAPPPINIAVPAQVTLFETSNSLGGILVTITGFDNNNFARTETLATVASTIVTGQIRWSQITGITVSNGSSSQLLEVGTAAVAQNAFGQGWPVYKRNYDFVNNFASDPAVVGRPRYYAELDQNTWQTSQAADQTYGVIVRFLKRPQTIVTAGTSWLGDRCGDLLFLTSLMEAEEYLKADDRFADLEGEYQGKLEVARVELRNSIRQGDYAPVKPAAAPAQG